MRLNQDPTSTACSAILSPRQRECLYWTAQGKSSSDIGAILRISARTVDFHILECCGRLGVRTRVQAVAEAVRRSLLDGPS